MYLKIRSRVMWLTKEKMDIAVLIPCYNEEKTIEKVVLDFKKELPDAKIYVFDNNSTDNTAKIVSKLMEEYKNIFLEKEFRQGKGNVVRSMFRKVDANIYVLVDGDDTYPVNFVHKLIEPIAKRRADMVIGDRHSNGTYRQENKRPFHNFGNNLVRFLINRLFSNNLKDIMSGYRVFSREFVKSMPVLSNGFEIETEMTIHALDKKFLIKEIPIEYKDRPEGSYSKLNTFSDGTRVLKTILWLFKDYKPLTFFTIIFFIFFILSLMIGIPVVLEFIETGYITKLPSAVLAVGLMLISITSLFSGFILDTIVKQHRENYELYLNSRF
jgi:glycosyltransferase involved in cell wall biosynthesis